MRLLRVANGRISIWRISRLRRYHLIWELAIWSFEKVGTRVDACILHFWPLSPPNCIYFIIIVLWSVHMQAIACRKASVFSEAKCTSEGMVRVLGGVASWMKSEGLNSLKWLYHPSPAPDTIGRPKRLRIRVLVVLNTVGNIQWWCKFDSALLARLHFARSANRINYMNNALVWGYWQSRYVAYLWSAYHCQLIGEFEACRSLDLSARFCGKEPWRRFARVVRICRHAACDPGGLHLFPPKEWVFRKVTMQIDCSTTLKGEKRFHEWKLEWGRGVWIGPRHVLGRYYTPYFVGVKCAYSSQPIINVHWLRSITR